MAAKLVDLEDLWDELSRGRIYEASLRSTKWVVDGLQDGEDIYIDPRNQVLEILIHELLHRRKPRFSERTVDKMAKDLVRRMTEEEKRRWWRQYRKTKQRRKPVVVD
jgi:hypothetical protein